jgi:AraC family transcriptional regulator
MEVVVKDMPAVRVASVPHVGPYNQISSAFGKLGAIAGPAGLFQRPEAAMIGIYYDDPETTPAEKLRSEAGIRVSDTASVPAGLIDQRLSAGRYAMTVHVGPYDQLGEVWARLLGEWLPKSGHRIRSGASYELYLNDPTRVPKDQLRTEIYQPIA